ncbi:TPA: right-handed parallel beta-helix repeat-containing protein, partial [Escherichia coli]|nr:right-handed parallel beta-helix repeat-containing protein [Escherichia coli]HCT6186098.1 right-handed parallel beta-helix repeat-containing protein [Escherichia coli]
MAFNPLLGTTNADVFMGNVQRLDELVNGPAADVPDRAGDPLYSWRLIRQSLIPLSRQYMTLADAQADIANIPDGSATYVRSTDGSSLADEYINNGGTLEATGRQMPSQVYIDSLLSIIQQMQNQSLYRDGVAG